MGVIRSFSITLATTGSAVGSDGFGVSPDPGRAIILLPSLPCHPGDERCEGIKRVCGASVRQSSVLWIDGASLLHAPAVRLSDRHVLRNTGSHAPVPLRHAVLGVERVARRPQWARRVRHGEKDTQDHAANAHLPCRPASGWQHRPSSRTNSLSVGRRESVSGQHHCGHRARILPPGTRALGPTIRERPLWLHWRSMPFWDGSRTGQPPCGGAMPQISGSRRPSARPRPPRSATRGERRASSRCA